MATELLLDPAIKRFVLVPIFVLTVSIEIIKLYAGKMFFKKNKGVRLTLDAVKDNNMVKRARMLTMNNNLIPASSFEARRSFFVDSLKTRATKVAVVMDMMNPEMAAETMKGSLFNLVPVIFVFGWINRTFSGFIATRLPFPLTRRFSQMLQSGIALPSLETSWVSSASWFFLACFGVRGFIGVLTGGEKVESMMSVFENNGEPAQEGLHGNALKGALTGTAEYLSLRKGGLKL